LALCQFRTREVISAKISTLLNTTLLNNPTKFGVKIFRRYQVITFYVLGHFLAAPCTLQPYLEVKVESPT